jgi:O-antigen/teichoic acid export membrane protein
MPGLRKNAAILLLNNLLGGALAFLISIVIGRGLGVSGLGQYSFILAWVVPLTTLADFGLSTLITRDVARSPAQAPALLHVIMRTFPILAAAALLGTWLVVGISTLTPELAVGVAIGALLVILDPWYGLYTAVFRAFGRMTPILFLNVLGLLAQLGLATLAVAAGAGVVGVFVAVIAVNVVQLGAAWAVWRTMPERAPYHGQPGPNRAQLLRSMAPFALSGLLAAASGRVNIFLLERLAGDVGVGYYSAANRFLEAGRILPNAIFGALFPALAALSARPAEERRLFWRAFGFLAVAASLIAAALTIGAPLLIRLTYGDRFRGAEPLLALLGWALVPTVIRGLLSLRLFTQGKEATANKVALAVLIGQAVIGLALIPALGTFGAAWAALLAELGAIPLLLALDRLDRTSGRDQRIDMIGQTVHSPDRLDIDDTQRSTL